jgi:hypothetical protein
MVDAVALVQNNHRRPFWALGNAHQRRCRRQISILGTIPVVFFAMDAALAGKLIHVDLNAAKLIPSRSGQGGIRRLRPIGRHIHIGRGDRQWWLT